MSDLDKWIDIAKECKYLPENDLKKLCDMVCDYLLEESNIQPVSTPVTVCGDIHGQFYDLEELFRKGGQVPDTNYIFMGDFVDRGYYSLETFTRLLTLKAKWPDRITLLRGNHESRQITQVYGFYDECQKKYGNANAWRYCCRVFDLLTIAALIEEQVLCVHGGLSPDIRTLDQIRTIDRNQEIPHEVFPWNEQKKIKNRMRKSIGGELHKYAPKKVLAENYFHSYIVSYGKIGLALREFAFRISFPEPIIREVQKGAFCDLVWSDPEDVDKWTVSPRGAGWLFGAQVTYEFMDLNALTLICRAHQLVHEGYKYMFKDKLVTVWSAPNYCYRCGNVASILQFRDVEDKSPLIFHAVPDTERVIPPRTTTPYFL